MSDDRLITDISVGKRHRVDMGDIERLADSIHELGLLHPVVIRPDGLLIAGERRLEACKALGMTRIPVTVIDLAAVALGELAENSMRKNFLPSEMVAIKRAVEPLIAMEAKQRQGARTDIKESFLNVAAAGQTRDKSAAYVGVSGRTLEKAEAIVRAAEAEPARFAKLAADMDRTGRVDGPFKRLQIARQAALIRAEPPPLPANGPHRVAVVDPPWPYEDDEDPADRALRPFATMSIPAIAAIPVASLTHEDAIVWLWVTNFHMRRAYEVLDCWGFQPKTILTWVKDRWGHGALLRSQTEHALMAVRGKPIVELTNQSTVLYAPVRKPSEKPTEFFELVEKLCPAPRYAELFARCRRPLWDGHGDQYPAEAAE